MNTISGNLIIKDIRIISQGTPRIRVLSTVFPIIHDSSQVGELWTAILCP